MAFFSVSAVAILSKPDKTFKSSEFLSIFCHLVFSCLYIFIFPVLSDHFRHYVTGRSQQEVKSFDSVTVNDLSTHHTSSNILTIDEGVIRNYIYEMKVYKILYFALSFIYVLTLGLPIADC